MEIVYDVGERNTWEVRTMSNVKADFGQNLRALRVMAGETLEELGQIVGVSKSAIANYEQGTRAPNLEALKEMAAHYGVSVDYLLRAYIAEAVPTAKKERPSVKNDEGIKEYVATLFPLVIDEESEENGTYGKAVLLAQTARDRFERFDWVEPKRLEECIVLFAKAFKENPEHATCGYIWSVFFLWWTNYFGFFKNIQKEKDFTYNLRAFYEAKGEDYQALKKDVMDIQGETMLEFLDYLRHSSKMKDLGEYFYALWYLLDLADGVLPAEINATVGSQLMQDQYRLGNPYAQKLLTIEKDFR